jgi:hypothetical protein
MYGTGVQDLGSDLDGATEKHRIPVRIAFRAGARSNLVVSILSCEEWCPFYRIITELEVVETRARLASGRRD